MNKYLNKKTVVDNIIFDSKKEANYYCDLKLLKHAGEVIGFDLQPEFILQPKFKKNGRTYREIKYIADFFVLYKDGRKEVVDTKGFKTKDFKIKQKLFEYIYQQFELKII